MARRDAIGWAGMAMAAAAPKRLGGLLAALAGLFLALAVPASAQQIPNMGSPMVPNAAASGGSFPPAACVTANGVIFNNAVPCDAGLTYGGVAAGAPLAIAQGTITTNIKALSITATWNAVGTTFDAPLFMNITNTASASGSLLMDLQIGGASVFAIGKTNGSILMNNASEYIKDVGGRLDIGAGGSTALSLLSSGTIFLNTQFAATLGANSGDTAFSRDGVGILGLAAGLDTGTVTLPASLRVYNVASTALANYERGVIDWNTTSNVLTIGTQNAGTGSTRNMQFVIGGVNKLDYGVTAASQWSFANGGVVNTGGVLDTINSNASVALGWNLGQITVYSSGIFAWSSTTNAASGVNKTVLSSPGTANVQFGAANVNGAPVAQTISFQGALAGSATNQAGAAATIIGSLGTGTGTNGDIIFQTGVKTTTGTVQGTATQALVIKGESQQAVFAQGISTGSNVTVPNGAFFAWSSRALLGSPADGELQLSNQAGSQLINLFVDGVSNILAQVNGTNPNTFRVYKTSDTGNTNYERGVLDWTTTANVLTIGTQFLGTGVARNMQFVIGGVNKLDFGITNPGIFTFQNGVNFNGQALTGGNFISTTSHGWVGQGGSGPSITDGGTINSIQFINGSGSTIILQLGGTTSSFPAIKRVAAAIAHRLADDSADAAITAAAGTFSGALSATLASATGTNAVCNTPGASSALTVQVWATGCAASSADYKQNIRPIASALAFDIVMRMRAVQYEYRPEQNMGSDEHVGFTAQQIAGIEPHVPGYDPVTYRADGGLHAVKYNEMLPLFATAIQVLDDRKADRIEVSTLRADNDNLRIEFDTYRRAHP